MADSAAIAIGPGTLYVADIATADPTSATASLPSAWRAVGYTEEGNTFTYSIETEDVEVAEEFDPVRIDTVKRSGKVAFQMAEMTRANLVLALNLGAAGTNDTTAVEPPAPGAELRVKIVLDTLGGSRWLFRRCIQAGEIEVSRKKSPDKALLPVEFRLEKPTGLQPFKVFPASSGYLT